MADADIITLAEAIKTALNEGTFSQAFTAVRGYVPTYDLENNKALVVTIVPKSDTAALDSRCSCRHTLVVDIGIQKKVPNVFNATIDPLMALVQEIADYFLFGRNPAGASLTAPQVRLLYVQEHLQTLMQFTSVCELSFILTRFEE